MSLLASPWPLIRRRSASIVVAVQALSLALLGVALAVVVARDQAAAVPVALVGLVLGWGLVRLLYRHSAWQFLVPLFLAAFAIRIVAAVVVDPFLVSTYKDVQYVGFLFEDDRAYDKIAWAVTRIWAGALPGIARSDEYLLNNYTYTMAGLYALVGHELLAAKFVNCFFGAMVPSLAFSLGKEIAGVGAGRFAALASAFFPSMILWSVLNLKDMPVVLLIVACMAGTLRFARAPGLGVAAATLVAFVCLENLRLYAFFALGWLMPVTFFVANRAAWRRRLAVGVPFTLAVLSLVYMTNQSQWLGLRYLTPKRAEALDYSRGFGSGVAESGIQLESIPRTEGGWQIQLVNAPKVLPYVLFAPFPWAARRPRELALIPEMLAWYAVLTLAVLGLVACRRERWREMFMLVSYGGGMVLIFSLIEGNVGTIFRHRAMLMPPTFALAGLGLVWLRAWWVGRQTEPRFRASGAELREVVPIGNTELGARKSTPVV